MSLVALDGLTMRYPGGVTALDELTLADDWDSFDAGSSFEPEMGVEDETQSEVEKVEVELTEASHGAEAEPSGDDDVFRFSGGSGETIRCVIWFCDLRGFTSLGDRLSAAELVAVLVGLGDEDRERAAYFRRLVIDDSGG